MAGGMHGRGCVCSRGHVWQGGRGVCSMGVGACVAGEHAWQGDVHGRGCAWQGVCIAG